MNITEDFNKKDDKKRAITMGSFDALHKAHRLLIESTVEISKQKNATPSAITFCYKPNLKKKNNGKYILPKEEKIRLFEQMGIADLYLVFFDKKIKSMSADQFVKDILVDNLGVTDLVLGDDARFGNDMLGVDELEKICKKHNVRFKVIGEVRINDKRVSSTLIREMLDKGIVGAELEQYLGRPYIISSEVVHGNNYGNKIGFPTANLEIGPEQIMPKNGVYYAECIIDGEKYVTAISIGNKPSVKNPHYGLEAHILDFDKNIYGKKITVIPKKYLRAEIKFDKIEDLVLQMNSDVETVRKLSNGTLNWFSFYLIGINIIVSKALKLFNID